MNNSIEYFGLYWMNIFLNEYFGFCFELNFELNHFSARFNEKMNFQNVSNRATPYPPFILLATCLQCPPHHAFAKWTKVILWQATKERRNTIFIILSFSFHLYFVHYLNLFHHVHWTLSTLSTLSTMFSTLYLLMTHCC